MTETGMPKLGQGAGVVAEVDLVPGEIPVSAWDVLYYPSWWRFRGGILYLTSARLLWISWRPALPWVDRVIEIALQRIREVHTRRVLFAPFFALAGPFHRQVVVTLTTSRRYAFSPLSSAPDAGEVLNDIQSILRQQGLWRD